MQFHPVIAVQERDVFSAHLVQAEIARRGKTSIFGMKNTDSFILPGILVADAPASIGGAIIDDEDFQMTVALVDHAVQALGEIGPDVVDRDDHRDKRSWSHTHTPTEPD